MPQPSKKLEDVEDHKGRAILDFITFPPDPGINTPRCTPPFVSDAVEPVHPLRFMGDLTRGPHCLKGCPPCGEYLARAASKAPPPLGTARPPKRISLASSFFP